MLPEQRRNKILDHVSKHQRVTVGQLSDEFGVSQETVRRDLTTLADRGELRKVHGGAIHVQTATEAAISRRVNLMREEKARIAVRATELIATGDSVMVDGGTTTAAFARQLAKQSGLTVVTNSVEVASRIWHGSGDNTVHLLGGKFDGGIAVTLGAETIRQIGRVRADHAVLTVAGIDGENGIMYLSYDEANVAMAMVAQANAVTVLIDHSKIGRQGLIKACDLDAITRVISDEEPPATFVARLHTAGVELIIA